MNLPVAALGLLPIAVVALVACVRWPWIPVVAFLGVTMLVEQYFGETKAPGYALYSGVVGGISPWEMLLYLSLACVTLDCVRRRRLPPVPLSIALALGLMTAAFVVGSIVGYSEGAGIGAQIDGWRNVLPLVVIAPLVAAVLPTGRPLRVALAVVAVAVGIKALLVLGLTAQSGGVSLDVLIYYEITMNWVFMGFCLCVLACVVRGVKLPLWVWVVAGLALLGFIIGLKRALWLGSVAGIALILAFGLGRLGRRLVVPVVVVTVVTGWLLLASGLNVGLSGPVAERVTSLNPEKISTNAQDRYRLDERANVWAGIREHPIVGLGQGVPWKAVEPLGIEHESARDYVHFAVLWFWMKYSLLGAIAYAAILGSVIFIGIRVRRRHPDPLISAMGLGIAATVISLAVAELTVTWTGATPRFTVLLGAVVGALCVMHREARQPPDLELADIRPAKPEPADPAAPSIRGSGVAAMH